MSGGSKNVSKELQDLLRQGTWSALVDDRMMFSLPASASLGQRKQLRQLADVVKRCRIAAKGTTMIVPDALYTALIVAADTGTFVDLRNLPAGYVASANLLSQMLYELQLQSSFTYRVLVPCAGTGALIVSLAENCPSDVNVEVTALEQDFQFESRLRELYGGQNQIVKRLVFTDFLRAEPVSQVSVSYGTYPRIVMHPPFGEDKDLIHIQHAYDFLDRGGVLVSLLSRSFMLRNDDYAIAFRNWLEKLKTDGAKIEARSLPENSLTYAGLSISTAMLRIERGVV